MKTNEVDKIQFSQKLIFVFERSRTITVQEATKAIADRKFSYTTNRYKISQNDYDYKDLRWKAADIFLELLFIYTLIKTIGDIMLDIAQSSHT